MLQLLHHITPLLLTALTPKVRHMPVHRQTSSCMSRCVVKSVTVITPYYLTEQCDICPTYARTSTDKLVTHVALCREKCYSYYTILLTAHCCTHPESATYARTSTDKLVMHVALCREKCYSYYTILLHCSTHPDKSTRMSRCVVKSRQQASLYIDRQAACRAVS